jgi:hypothetical protein
LHAEERDGNEGSNVNIDMLEWVGMVVGQLGVVDNDYRCGV